MLIVSQDKETIINFDKVIAISTSEGKIGVSDDLRDVDFCLIGEYQTEERAKEVLQEIAKKYSSYLQLNGGPALIQGQMDVQPNIFNIPKIYEMPEK